MGFDGTAETTRPVSPERLLFVWLSPSFPVGGFAYSQGLELAVERGLVSSRATLEEWLGAIIAHGALRNDLILLAAAHRAAADRERGTLLDVNALACALQPSAERYLETTQQGGSFVSAISDAWPADGFDDLRAWIGMPIAYPVAFGIAAAAHAIPLPATVEAFAFAWAGNQTSAAIRLGVVGQTDAQRVTASLAENLRRAAEFASGSTMEDVGGAAFSADLASLEHETQYSRLFRS